MFINLSGCTVENVKQSLLQASPSAQQWEAWATELQHDAASLDHRRPGAGMLRAAILDSPDVLQRCIEWTWNRENDEEVWKALRRLTRVLLIGGEGGLHNLHAHVMTRLRELVRVWRFVTHSSNEDSDDPLRYIHSRLETYNRAACTALSKATAALRCVAIPRAPALSEGGGGALSARFSTSSTILDPDTQSVSSETVSSHQMFPSGETAGLWNPEALREHAGAASSELRQTDHALRRIDVAVGCLQRSIEFDTRSAAELHEAKDILSAAAEELSRTQQDLRSEEVVARAKTERQDVIARRIAVENRIENLQRKHVSLLEERTDIEAKLKSINDTIFDFEGSLVRAKNELVEVSTLEARHKLGDGPLDHLKKQHHQMEQVSKAMSCSLHFVEALQMAAAQHIEPHIRVHHEELHEAWATGLRSCTALFSELHQVVVNVAGAGEKLRDIGTSTGQSVVHPLRKVGERVAQHYYVAHDVWRSLQLLRDRIRAMATIDPEVQELIDGSAAEALWAAAVASYGEIESLFPTTETPPRTMHRSASSTSANELLVSPLMGERPLLPPKLMQRKERRHRCTAMSAEVDSIMRDIEATNLVIR